MTHALPIRRVVLYKHGVGYLERRGRVEGSASLHLDFKARDMNDVLKSMTVLDLTGGSVSAVSYDSTKPLETAARRRPPSASPNTGSLTALLGQMKGARVRARVGGGAAVEGAIVGLESAAAWRRARPRRPALPHAARGRVAAHLRPAGIGELAFLDDAVRKDLEFYLATVLSSYKKDTKRLSMLTGGRGRAGAFVSYVLEAPVWKTSYRILLDEKESRCCRAGRWWTTRATRTGWTWTWP